MALLRRRLRHHSDPDIWRDARRTAALGECAGGADGLFHARRPWPCLSPVPVPDARRAAYGWLRQDGWWYGRPRNVNGSPVGLPTSGAGDPGSTSCSAFDNDGWLSERWRSQIGEFGQELRLGESRRWHQPAYSRRRILFASGFFRLRQDDDLAHDRRVRTADQRSDPAGWRRYDGYPAAQAPCEHRVPKLCAVSPSQCFR